MEQELKSAISMKKRTTVNDRKVKDTIENLLDSMYIQRDEKGGNYTIIDPLVKVTIKGLK